MPLPCIKNKDAGLRELKSLVVETGNKQRGVGGSTRCGKWYKGNKTIETKNNRDHLINNTN